MCDAAILVLVPEAVVVLETVCHVIGIKEGGLRGVRETFTTEHFDVSPGDK